jgi:hypothetical protein
MQEKIRDCGLGIDDFKVPSVVKEKVFAKNFVIPLEYMVK